MTAKTMTEVLAKHWSASTHADHKPFVDKCDGCGAVIFSWGDGVDANEALAAHQSAALTAAGFGLVADDKRRMELAALLAYEAVEEGALGEAGAKALEDAADRFDTRSETLLKTMQNMADSREYGPHDITRYGAYSAEANTTTIWLRARAAGMRQG